MKVPISKIIVEDRFREDFGDIEGLAKSIQTHGLLHPIVVVSEGDSYRLVAGERRLRAHQLLGLEEIEVRLRENLDELQQREIELEENLHRKQFDWPEEVRAKKEIHRLQQKIYGRGIQGRRTGGWTQQDTATALGISTGTLSMDIQLAEALEAHPELAKEKNKSTALRKFRKMEEQRIIRELARRKAKSGVEVQGLYHGNCLEVMRRVLADQSVQLVVTDPPWGIAMDTRSRLSETNIIEYADSVHKTLELLDAAFRECYRVLSPNSHAYFFFGIRHYASVLDMLTRAGFEVDPVPITWDKGSPGQASRGYTYTQQTEFIFHCWKGRRQLNGAPSNLLRYDRVPGRERIHSAQKPVALVRELIEQSSLPGDTVLDPFAGSGSTVIAAIQARRNPIAIELEESTYAAMVERVEVERGEVEAG